MDVEELREQMQTAMNTNDEESFIAAIHPEGVFATVVFGDEDVFRGKDGARDWWARRSTAAVYEIYSEQVDRISEHALVITARLRVAGSERGMEDAPKSWIVIERDGLVYRYRPVESRAEAVAVAAEVEAA